MTMIGRGLTTYTSSGTGSSAVDSSYSTNWQPTGDPAYIAIDVSGVVGTLTADSSGFKSMVLTWYTQDLAYQPDLLSSGNGDIPSNYTIDVNSAAGGSLPGSGWVTVITVTGSLVHSRSHIVNMAGQNWIRLSITQQADGGTGASTLNVDLWDASRSTNSAHNAVNAGWFNIGDSITARTMMQDTVGQGGPSYTSPNALVNAINGWTPLQESGGMSGWKASDFTGQINRYMTYFPGRWVTMTLGTNEAIGSVSAATYGANMSTLLKAIVAAGKIPVVTTIPYGTYSGSTNIAGLNSQLVTTLAGFPTAVNGPDLYTLFQNGTIALDPDGIHPSNPAGCETMRGVWATFMAAVGVGA
jgi:hypothetical protein